MTRSYQRDPTLGFDARPVGAKRAVLTRLSLLGEQTIADDATGEVGRGRRGPSRSWACWPHAGASAGRQQLAGLFWPASGDAQALTNLRRELHHLRRLLGATPPWRSPPPAALA